MTTDLAITKKTTKLLKEKNYEADTRLIQVEEGKFLFQFILYSNESDTHTFIFRGIVSTRETLRKAVLYRLTDLIKSFRDDPDYQGSEECFEAYSKMATVLTVFYIMNFKSHLTMVEDAIKLGKELKWLQ